MTKLAHVSSDKRLYAKMWYTIFYQKRNIGNAQAAAATDVGVAMLFIPENMTVFLVDDVASRQMCALSQMKISQTRTK